MFANFITIKNCHLQIANIGPADFNYDESISTLRYANRAKLIKNAARINEDPKDALIRQFQMEIEKLRGQLSDGWSDILLVVSLLLSYWHPNIELFREIQ